MILKHITAHWFCLPGTNSGTHNLPTNAKKQKNPIPWFSNRTSRHEETILAHLRIGHTRLTHAYLFLGLFFAPPYQYCNEDHLTVPHLFSCPVLKTTHLLHSVPPHPSLSPSVTTQNKSIYIITQLPSINLLLQIL